MIQNGEWKDEEYRKLFDEVFATTLEYEYKQNKNR